MAPRGLILKHHLPGSVADLVNRVLKTMLDKPLDGASSIEAHRVACKYYLIGLLWHSLRPVGM